MKTSTMSRASVGVTGHTGQLFQVSLGHFLTTARLQEIPQQSELHLPETRLVCSYNWFAANNANAKPETIETSFR